MIYNDQMVAIEDAVDQLIAALKASEVFKTYQAKQAQLAQDAKAQALIQSFHDYQHKLAAIEPYGSYVPEAATLKKQTLAAKRDMDLNPSVAAYKLAKLQFETVVDTLTVAMTDKISSRIKVATRNPFFETKRKPHKM
ncbi:YlbF family regulator [Agrilactobacillus yilanensis]|uniref:YlbF family regulator n=1 Tax=Agrilactobacillus yilanensis TaxID=2485997 RepID=A0ABW4J698_9LACO|nr:YlbF family regulator [Agrilactobacillus yilanensis]